MATLKLELNGVKRSVKIPDSAFKNRLLPAFHFEYGQVDVEKEKGKKPVSRIRTDEELVNAFFDQLVRYMQNVIRRREQIHARKEATRSVEELPIE